MGPVALAEGWRAVWGCRRAADCTERPPLRETSGTSVVIQRSLWENFKVVEMIQH